MADAITGYAVQWMQPAVIGGVFEERFARGAFDRSLREYPDVAALWARDETRPLGRVSNGTLSLRSDKIGLWYSLTPDPKSPMGQEALATVASGTVDEVSVSFVPFFEEWDDRGELPTRLITEAFLCEISLVIWGAYGKSTSASLSRADNSSAAIRRIRERAERMQRVRGLR